MNTDEMITVHQLLGRIAYFHVAFIEPALADLPAPEDRPPAPTCCRDRLGHVEQPACEPAGLVDTAWTVPIDIAAALGVRLCRNEPGTCCARCLIRHSATVIADTWLGVETATYAGLVPSPTQRAGWCARIGTQLAEVFGEGSGGTCTAVHADTRPGDAPPADRFPLVGELLTLWKRPIGHAPVTSWLNHCADLGDITRVLRTRRGHEHAIADRTR
ncbi:hypothetical protein ABIA39_008857 [Nocardia sp. GAS34]|uniref:hypothetical protein n=1 Tax=unclassified Nocardia TaxID=2637762 RepID=UPI003D263DAD